MRKGHDQQLVDVICQHNKDGSMIPMRVRTTHSSLKMPINDIIRNSAASINQINSLFDRPVIMESDDRSDY
jgi:hypothetical protein